jgi:hypothetical protein
MELTRRESQLMSPRSARSLSIAALYAACLAAIGNAIVYFIAYATGIIPWNMLSPGRGVSITPRLVILVSVGGAIAGALIYALVRRFASDPVMTFRGVAALVVVLSFAAPYSIPTFTTSLMITLDVMHIIVYASTVWVLTVWAQRRIATASA